MGGVPFWFWPSPRERQRPAKVGSDVSIAASSPLSGPRLQDPLFCDAACDKPLPAELISPTFEFSSRSVFSTSHCIVSFLDAQTRSMGNFYFRKIFLKLFLTALGLRCCYRLSPCGEQGPLCTQYAGFSLLWLLLLSLLALEAQAQ